MTTTTVKETIVEATKAIHKEADDAENKKPKIDKFGRSYGTGRRKNSIARVWVRKKKGKTAQITINKLDGKKYLKRAILYVLINQPFVVTKNEENFDVICTVKGGGLTGQAGAIRHGITRALDIFDPTLHTDLKRAGFLTRDSRVVERKKPGRKKARKGKTYRKR